LTEILVTGLDLIDLGIRGLEPVIEEIIRKAEKEVHMMTYLFTAGALHILDLIENTAERGINIVIVVNNLQFQEGKVVSRLRHISLRFPHAKIYDFIDPEKRQLHAKVVVVDRKKAVVGSANLSWGGMYSNYEIGLFIEGKAAWKLAEIIDFLSSKSTRI